MPREVWLLGNPVRHSLSPAMQNAAFTALAIDCRYVVRELDAPELAAAIAEIRAAPSIIGANVTIPLKQSVIPLLDELDAMAARIGAVNTISRKGSRLIGSNTDVAGFRIALEEQGYAVAGKTVAIIGAGGAARAAAEAVRDLASRIVIISRNLEQAGGLVAQLQLDAELGSIDRLTELISGVDVIVNATPSDLPAAGSLRAGQHLFDLRSRRSAEGRAMLLHQGAASFEIWTGRQAPLETMRAALQHAAEAVPA